MLILTKPKSGHQGWRCWVSVLGRLFFSVFFRIWHCVHWPSRFSWLRGVDTSSRMGHTHVRTVTLAPLAKTVSLSTHYMHSSSVHFRLMDLVSALLFSVASCGFKVFQVCFVCFCFFNRAFRPFELKTTFRVEEIERRLTRTLIKLMHLHALSARGPNS